MSFIVKIHLAPKLRPRYIVRTTRRFVTEMPEVERRPMTEIWLIQLNMRLPVVPVPLLAGDPDVALDLQLALNTVYDALNYDLSVNYTRPPEVPLEGEAAAGAAELLRAAGFLTDGIS